MTKSEVAKREKEIATLFNIPKDFVNMQSDGSGDIYISDYDMLFDLTTLENLALIVHTKKINFRCSAPLPPSFSGRTHGSCGSVSLEWGPNE